MKISGLEKLTLKDFPGKLACIVFTQGCNYKCPFCQNSALLNHKEGAILEDFVYNYIYKRKNILEGVVISGGEPTIQKDLKEFITKIKDLNLKVKLDTNGSNPKVIKDLLDNNLLDYVAMDIKDTFNMYDEITGVKANLENIKESMNILKKAKKEGQIELEFRTTICKEYHNEKIIKEIIKEVGPVKYYLQNFEDSSDVINHNLTSFTKEELEIINESVINNPNVHVRGF